MTDLLRPFAGYLPQSMFGHRVVGPPSATLTAAQKEAAASDLLSFRNAAGRKARCSRDDALKWISDQLAQGVLLPIDSAVVVYRQEKGVFVANGILGDLSLEAYESGRVKRHEKTIAKTQKKMADYMRTTRIYGNPAVVAFRPATDVEEAIARHTKDEPLTTFTTVNGTSHKLWLVTGDAATELCQRVDSDLYITDGHHRLAAASQIASAEGRADARIPVGVFSANEFRLRSFARCISDADLDANTAIQKLQRDVELEEVGAHEAFPRSRFEFGAKIRDRYFRVRVPEDRISDDHYESLNTNLIQQLILAPVFGITKPRLDKRLRFVADLGDLRESCAASDAWILPFPLEVADVMTVADSNRTMPAKSTWFAPKLPSGLVIRPLDQP